MPCVCPCRTITTPWESWSRVKPHWSSLQINRPSRWSVRPPRWVIHTWRRCVGVVPTAACLKSIVMAAEKSRLSRCHSLHMGEVSLSHRWYSRNNIHSLCFQWLYLALSTFLAVLSRNRASGGGGDSVWAPTMDHHLCSCSGNPTTRNNHSYTLEGETAAPITLFLQNLNSSQSPRMYFFLKPVQDQQSLDFMIAVDDSSYWYTFN